MQRGDPHAVQAGLHVCHGDSDAEFLVSTYYVKHCLAQVGTSKSKNAGPKNSSWDMEWVQRSGNNV